MKIETLLKFYGYAIVDQTVYIGADKLTHKDCLRRSRQVEVFRKGIIRKFERLEKNLNCKSMMQRLANAAFNQAWDDAFQDRSRAAWGIDLINKEK